MIATRQAVISDSFLGIIQRVYEREVNKMAKWIQNEQVEDILECSNCGYIVTNPDYVFEEGDDYHNPLEFNYCPMCGEKLVR